jgi:trehalose 6-phosphate synthase/phosphatase
MPFEFIAAHYDDGARGRSSVAIVSEFTGCSRVLNGSLRNNPWNLRGLVSCCERALSMGLAEKEERRLTDLSYVTSNSQCEWFLDFLRELRKARKKEGMRFESLGFGAMMRSVSYAQDFRKLPVESVLARYRSSKNRLIFLDNEGTLSADTRRHTREYGAISDLKSRGSAPDEQVLECLRKLCEDPRNTVVVLSGRDRERMEEWFGSVRNLGLAAERGFFSKVPVATGEKWRCAAPNPDMAWKDICFAIMAEFAKRTQGSFIENKGSALVWQYRDADQHFGSWQAKELSSHLRELLFEYDIEVMEGKGYVEVKLRGINKGVAVTKVFNKVSGIFGEVDFVLCIGDDRSDEDMFEAVNALLDLSDGKDSNEMPGDDESQMSTTDDCSTESGLQGWAEQVMGARGSSAFGLLPRRHSSDEAGMLAKMERQPSAPTRAYSSFGMGFSGVGRGSSLWQSEDTPTDRKRRFFTCTVGRKPTAAKFYLDEVEEVTDLLGSLKSQHERRQKEMLPSYHTWSGGTRRSGRSGTMPGISSLSFGGPGGPSMGRTQSLGQS